MRQLVGLSARSAACVYLVAALAAVCTARSMPAHALDSNDQLADRGLEPWKTWRFFGPNHTEEAKQKYGAVPCYMYFKLNESPTPNRTSSGD